MASLTVNTPLGNVVLGSLINMIRKPIGVWTKNWGNIQANITRNVGGLYAYTPDAWGPSMGDLSDPDYTEKFGRPTFKVDFKRQIYPNYVEYVKDAYGASLSVTDINEFGPSIISLEDTIPGVVDDNTHLRDIADGEKTSLSPNLDSEDTILGHTSVEYLSRELSETIKNNTAKSNLRRTFSMFGQDIFGEEVDGFVKEVPVQFENILLRTEYQIDRNTVHGSSHGDVTTYVYDQENKGIDRYSIGASSKYSTFSAIDGGNKHDIIDKTNQLFQKGVIKTLVSSFHSESGDVDKDYIGASSFSDYGYSRGRNLLKRTTSEVNGYDNPYCRVWTNHHQYHRLADAIRPFVDGNDLIGPGDFDKEYNWNKFRSPNTGLDGGTGGGRLQKYGVINYKTNGLVNITPVDDGVESHKVDIKRCMFSIENLAWKNVFNMTVGGNNTSQNAGLSNEQKGPFGGRIMWFPPYDLKFDESVNADWKKTDFIGRGEGIYTYTNTNREGHLHFKLLIDHPSVINYWKKGISSAEKANASAGDVDDVDSAEQTLLRFFAGCETLSLNGKTTETTAKEPESEPTPEATPDIMTLTSFVFFPNNYTGYHDGGRRAMLYLMNGMGAGQSYDQTTKTASDYTITTETCKDMSNKTVGGYEVRGGCTVSLRDTALEQSGDGYIATAKQGEEFLTLWAIKGSNNSNVSSEWWKMKWAYRVDKDKTFVDEVLHSPLNYVDCDSSGLNSGGKRDEIISTFTSVEGNELYSFTDLYVALNGGDAENMLSGLYNEDNVSTIKSLLLGSDNGYEIDSIICHGWASSPGKKNKTLSKRRANVVKQWLADMLGNKVDPNKIQATSSMQQGPKNGNISSLIQKLYRCCQIDINLKMSDVTDAVDKEESSDNKTVLSYGNNTPAENSATTKTVKTDSAGKKQTGSAVTNSHDSLNRYDNEAEFFRLLEIYDPVMHHKITDKIQYFDPAFHSITPEGFNARLTFLQQCMRQGPTVGGSDLYTTSTNANNLAFGRPPVCVLRIGDFYYTKIIITSLQIDYETPWDLNTEGIGVMPMIADITLNFHFIGGSSLRGPIDRLQNALSFNMYANTEVYDNRSDQVDYDENGNITNYKAFVPK